MQGILRALIVGVGLSLAGTAFAQSGGDAVSYKKKTIIDFSDVLIEGELTRPEGSYVVSRKQSSFSKLIQVRENFVPELLSSPNQL